MKSILISIKPRWCKKIFSGEKTDEIRKSAPNIEKPFKCYIYCTVDGFTGNRYQVKPYMINKNGFVCNGFVIGEFICSNILDIQSRGKDHNYDYCYESLNVFGNDDIEPYITTVKKSCISKSELNEYGKSTNHLYGWHISNPIIYDKPKKLSEFYKMGGLIDDKLTRPPQSWCYVEELKE